LAVEQPIKFDLVIKTAKAADVRLLADEVNYVDLSRTKTNPCGAVTEEISGSSRRWQTARKTPPASASGLIAGKPSCALSADLEGPTSLRIPSR